MELHVWTGEKKWGLPSMDLKSLQMLTYIKFSGAPVEVKSSSNPRKSPSGELPCFKCSEGIFKDFSQMATYLRKQNFGCDYELDPKQCSDVLAYEHLLLEKLLPALSFYWWFDTNNYDSVIRKWHYENIPLPYRLWVPGTLQKEQKDYIESLFEEERDLLVIETAIQKCAQECLTSLSHRLGEEDYFFGRNPSTIDALLFPYLALLLKVQLPNTSLQSHIKGCPNLLQYVSRILHKYFPSNAKEAEPRDIDRDTNSSRNMMIFGLFSFVSMLTYGISTGIVQVDLGDSKYPDVDESASEELFAYK